ncbi:flagellar biosynthesis protein FlhF [Aliidiomarina minuta]|uniref:Flagellar biosynthesis protein FlhF n=1 Tax=Aliidiomarina minuta TaxID=880057 RepID=A0A432W8I5_9GAMM|nr:flagellar biosynthesis protein FlhF [Aliidiomarina minuta]RUO26369.1 flagellar biosynthesis protein FlhF [Aliidiomarina minuta]
MKIKRFFGTDMRSALAEVKEVLGPDAVIMSNKRVSGGVEIMAAFDQEAPEPKRRNSASDSGQQVVRGGPEKQEAIADSLQALLARQQGEPDPVPPRRSREEKAKPAYDPLDPSQEAQHNQQHDEHYAGFAAPRESRESSQRPSPRGAEQDVLQQRLSTQDATISSMKSDMSAIRNLLEQQVSGLMWQDMERREPTRAMLIKKLTELGLTEQVSDQLSCFIPEGLSEDEAWKQTIDLLQGQIATTRNDILQQGGIVALVGPTGVGKTTTVAKLAARYAQMHGPDSVAMVTTDTFRIAASEQLQTYARIIGCPIKVAKDADELNAVLLQLRQRRLVLIDTAGMGQRDLRLSEQLSTLMENSRLRIRPYLVLSSTAQAPVQNEIVRQFKKIPLNGCIFTKLDECLSLGEVLSTAIHNSLPISYLTDGQQVPEDIKVADARYLIEQAAAMAAKTKPESYRFNAEASSQLSQQ